MLDLTGDVLRVEVHDRRRDLPVDLGATPDAERGRGLRVVDSLAQDWGALSNDRGKVVWVEIAVPASESVTVGV